MLVPYCVTAPPPFAATLSQSAEVVIFYFSRSCNDGAARRPQCDEQHPNRNAWCDCGRLFPEQVLRLHLIACCKKHVLPSVASAPRYGLYARTGHAEVRAKVGKCNATVSSQTVLTRCRKARKVCSTGPSIIEAV